MQTQTATFATGCFWCTEALFQQLRGVKRVTPGFTGGDLEHPSYDEVSTGNTGHAEAVQIEFDPSEISYSTLLDVFWHVHNPTTLNRQGADIGPQYRSAIFYHDEEQKQLATASKQKMDESETFSDPIVTEISSFKTFYPAGEEHKDYYKKNPNAAYCRLVIDPKLEKFWKKYKDLIQ